MAVIELAGVALAALLSENFVLVSCMGIGTRLRAAFSTAETGAAPAAP